MTNVIVPPHTWHPIHTTGTEPAPNQPDPRMVTECYHTNPGNIMLTITVTDSERPTVRPAHDMPAHGYRLRTIPYEDHTYQQFVQAHRPTSNNTQ